MQYLSITEVPLQNKRVLMRVDFNVPIVAQKITSIARIKAHLKSIQYALDQGAGVILISHLGRPIEGTYDHQFSLAPVAVSLSDLLKRPVTFKKNWLSGVDCKPGDVVLCENVRFNIGESTSDEILSKKMAQLCDVFVMDAFASSHRAHASTYGVAKHAPIAVAGLLLCDELSALNSALQSPKPPLAAIVGGAKVSSKLTVLENLIDQVDQLILGGGIANTFLMASGFNIGASLVETDLVDTARMLIKKAQEKSVNMPLPTDVRVAKKFDKHQSAIVKTVQSLDADDIILDVGPATELQVQKLLNSANTILWNGPLGVFEFDAFSEGTRALAKTIAETHAFSVAGGGDTIAAIEKFGIQDQVSYISTAGGAFLEFIEGKTLPGVEVLSRANN